MEKVGKLHLLVNTQHMAGISQSSPAEHAGGKVRAKKQSTRIDMTPMVDLAFLLLTFFYPHDHFFETHHYQTHNAGAGGRSGAAPDAESKERFQRCTG